MHMMKDIGGVFAFLPHTYITLTTCSPSFPPAAREIGTAKRQVLREADGNTYRLQMVSQSKLFSLYD